MEEGKPEKHETWNPHNYSTGFWDTVVAMKPNAALPTAYSKNSSNYVPYRATEHADTPAIANRNGGNILTDAVIKNNPSNYFAVMANENIHDYHFIKHSQEAMNAPYTVSRNSDGTFTLIKFANRYRTTHTDGSTDGNTAPATNLQYAFWQYADARASQGNPPKPEAPVIHYHHTNVALLLYQRKKVLKHTFLKTRLIL